MGSKKNYLENEILDHIVNAGTWDSPGTVYSALFTAIPADDSDGTEVATDCYTRQTTSFCTAAATVTGQVVNTAAVTFPTCTTAYTVVGWALLTDVATGTQLYWATVTTLAVGVGDQATFAVGNITITED
jgi:hypothetical protein